MREIIEAKKKQAEEQLAIWRQKLGEAQERCVQWDMAIRVCNELLAEDVPVVLAEEESP